MYLEITELIPAVVVFILGMLGCFIGLYISIKRANEYDKRTTRFKDHGRRASWPWI